MKKYLSILFLLSYSFNAFAQEDEQLTDSLLRKYYTPIYSNWEIDSVNLDLLQYKVFNETVLSAYRGDTLALQTTYDVDGNLIGYYVNTRQGFEFNLNMGRNAFPSLESVYIKDDNKNIAWRFDFDVELNLFATTDYHNNGRATVTSYYNYMENSVRSKYELVNGVKTGLEINYYENGAIYNIYIYENNVLNGPHTSYYKSGALHSQSFYLGGLLHGKQCFFRNDGGLSGIEIYDNGVRVKTSRREDPLFDPSLLLLCE